MKQILWVVILLAIAACASEDEPVPAQPDDATMRTVSGGEIIGLTTAAGAHAWRGLPFAAAPQGDLRWRAPRPPAAWDGRRDATRFAERCMQMTNGLNVSEGIDPGLYIGSEDCLYLDIYAPPDAQSKKLPVMVWVHGGSNVWGRASSYDGSNLALNEGVIIVPVQYRLGPLGWFAQEWVRDSADVGEDAAANFALLDLIASLKWVRENIAAFGGDPENITVFGESAGGHNVAALMASPLAAGSFDRAIIQSGSFDSVALADAEMGESGDNPSKVIVERLGATSAADLRAVSAEDLLIAYGKDEYDRLALPTVIQDGVTLPLYPLREAFGTNGAFNAVPIITGTNRDEMKFFHIASPELTKKIFGIFLVPRDKDYYDAVSDYLSRIWRIRSVDQPAAMMAAAGHDEVYAYRFDWDEGGRFLFTDLGRLLGAGHAVEIPFVFNRFKLLGPLDKTLFKKNTLKTRQELADRMGSYWAEFARGGDPSGGGDGLLIWPQWQKNGGSLMRFDSANDGGVEVLRDVYTVERLVSELKMDQRLDDEERCAIVEAAGVWLPALAGDMAREIGCALAAQ